MTSARNLTIECFKPKISIMCRIGAIKSKKYLHPSIALKLMRSQQKGHDDSGFAFVMQDLGGIFEHHKDLPILSMAGTVEGTRKAEDILMDLGFKRVLQWTPHITNKKGLKIDPLPNYVFEAVQYPKSHKYATQEEKEELLLDTALKIRKALEEDNSGYIYAFWKKIPNFVQKLSQHNAARTRIMILFAMRHTRFSLRVTLFLQTAKTLSTKRINIIK